MKRNSDLRNTWSNSSCVMQMLKRQTRVKGAVGCIPEINTVPGLAVGSGFYFLFFSVDSCTQTKENGS